MKAHAGVFLAIVASAMLLDRGGGTSALALGTEEFGNRPVPERDYTEWPNLLRVLNDPHRVYHYWVNGGEGFYFQGPAEALNQALRWFALVRMEPREAVLLPGPASGASLTGGRTYSYDWCVSLNGGISRMMTRGKGSLIWNKDPVLTIFIGGGNIELDKVRIPKGVTLHELSDLRNRYTQAILESGDPTIRGSGASRLARLDPSSQESLSTVARLLGDTNEWVRLSAVIAMKFFGKNAASTLPALRQIAGISSKDLAEQARKSIAAIEAARIDEAEVSRRNAVLEKIGGFRKTAVALLQSASRPEMKLGGIVRDLEGQPIASAVVSICTVIRDQVGQLAEEEVDSATTDASGQWTSEGVSPECKSLIFKLSRKEFRPCEYSLSESSKPQQGEISRAELLALKAVLVMKPSAVTIAGAVMAAGGKPVTGAEVRLLPAGKAPKDLSASTDSLGRYRLVLAEAPETGEDMVVAVCATGFAPQCVAVKLEDDARPVAFKLGPAKPLLGRVIGSDGKPIPGATVKLASWKGLLFPKWETQTDAQGRFRWDSAPAENAFYSVACPGFVPVQQQGWTAGDGEAVCKLSRAGLIVGTVVDAKTKAPIQDFQIVGGHGFRLDDYVWDRDHLLRGSNGAYSYSYDGRYGGGHTRLLAEAPGYLPRVSPALSAFGWFTNDFELRKGEGPKGILKLPSGEPAGGAQVALLTGEYTVLKDSQLMRQAGAGDSRSLVRTDGEGRFALPAVYAALLVAVSPEGYAEVKWEPTSTNLNLVLQSWGRVEGIVCNGRQPASNERIWVTHSRVFAMAAALMLDFGTYLTRSDDQGHFVLTDVPPGERFLIRVFPKDLRFGGGSPSHGERVTVKAGEVTHVVFGGKGRCVTGKVVSEDPKREITWPSDCKLTTQHPQPPLDKSEAEQEAWNEMPEIKAAQARYMHYHGEFAGDGSFRIEEVPPGKYDLGLMFFGPGEEVVIGGRVTPRPGKLVGSISREVVVPGMPSGLIDEPLDLGTLVLKFRKP